MEILSIAQVAKELDLSEMRVRTLLRLGRIQAAKDESNRWRVTRADMELYSTSLRDRASSNQAPRVEKRLPDGAVEPTLGPAPEGKPLIIHIPSDKLRAVTDYLLSNGIIPQNKNGYSRALARTWQDAYRNTPEDQTFDWRAFSDQLNLKMTTPDGEVDVDFAPVSGVGTSYVHAQTPDDSQFSWQTAWNSQVRPQWDPRTGKWSTSVLAPETTKEEEQTNETESD